MAADQAQVLSGWGRTSPSRARVVETADLESLRAAVLGADRRGVLARGLGRSYGDAAQNGGGLVTRWTRAGIGPIDATGVVEVDAGAGLRELLAVSVASGWFPPVVPGTSHITVGGAVGCDVHGKNHTSSGSISAHLLSLTLMDGTGTVRTLSSRDDPAAFWATVGGMGLTGVVLSARLRLMPLPSAWMAVTTRRAVDLAGAVEALSDESAGPYAAAWVDTLSTGRRMGRAVITTGRHLPADALHPAQRATPMATPTTRSLTAPRVLPPRLLSAPIALVFNELWYRRAPISGTGVVPWGTFLQPLDRIAGWNRLYGRRGFVQYQMVAPQPETVATMLERMAAARVPSFLAVLKRLGPGNDAPLSFPRRGWSLAVDVPADVPGLRALLDQFDELVAAAGGRVYLAKDSRLRPDVLAEMYPRLADWRSARDRLDPAGRFQSDLGRRLRLTCPRAVPR